MGFGRLTTEVVASGSPAMNSRGDLEVLYLLGAPYHTLGLIDQWRSVGVAYSTESSSQGFGAFVMNMGYLSGVEPQSSPGVRTFPCNGVSGIFRSIGGEFPSPFPTETSPVWGHPVIVKGDGDIRITSETISGPTGPVSIKVVYGEGRTVDPNARCKANTACIIPVVLSAASTYQVNITGTNGGAPFTRSFSFSTR